jgi:membrane fusion protein, heavy metal efflux system
MTFTIKNKIIAGCFFFLCLLIFSACGNKDAAPKEEMQPEEEAAADEVEVNPVQFKAAQIVYGSFELKNLSDVITANGYTKVPPQNQADVSVFVNGVLKTINVSEGQYVHAGQTIAMFQSIEFNNIRLEKAKLVQELQSAKVSRDYLTIEYARQKILSEEEVNAKKIFQKVSADLQMEKKKIETIGSQIKILDENIKVGGNSASATIAIKAPISGYITAINAKIGSNVTPGTSLFSIINNAVMHVDILVYEKDLFKVAVGQDVRFVLTNQGNKEIMGKIFSIGKAFENESKAVAVHTTINNKDARLIHGMYVNALIDIGATEVNTLPQEAVVKADGKEYIFIAEGEAAEKHENEKKDTAPAANVKEEHKDDGIHFKRIEVKTGTTQFGSVQVTPMAELPKAAKVVVKGAYYLQSAMSNAAGGDDHGH